MTCAVSLRGDYSATELRGLASATKNANQSRRLLSLAAVSGRDEPDGGGPDRRDGPTNAARLGPSLQWPRPRGSAGQLVQGPCAPSLGGAARRDRATRRDRPGQGCARGRTLASDRSAARHRGALRDRLPRAHGRQAPQDAGLLAHQWLSASPGSGRAHDRGVQKNFPATLRAHLTGISTRKPVEIWFQDEARIGQKNGLVRQWAKRGTRPRQPADQRYESAYLFGAICPARGTGSALDLPFADTEAMQLHLDEIARTVTKGAHAVLLLDRAGWHTTAALAVPSNITMILLPSRAPELNPVENIWQHLRQTWLSNRVFNTDEEIIEAACDAWRRLIAQPRTITSIGSREWALAGQR